MRREDSEKSAVRKGTSFVLSELEELVFKVDLANFVNEWCVHRFGLGLKVVYI